MFVLDTLEGWKLWLVRWLVIMLRLDLGTVYLKSMQVCIICAVFCWYLRSVNMWFCVCVLHACVCVCALMHVHAYMCVYAYMRACVCVCEWFVCSICGMNTLIKRKTHEEEHYLTITQWILFIFTLTKRKPPLFVQHPFLRLAKPLASLVPLILAAKEAQKGHWRWPSSQPFGLLIATHQGHNCKVNSLDPSFSKQPWPSGQQPWSSYNGMIYCCGFLQLLCQFHQASVGSPFGLWPSSAFSWTTVRCRTWESAA